MNFESMFGKRKKCFCIDHKKVMVFLIKHESMDKMIDKKVDLVEGKYQFPKNKSNKEFQSM